MATTSRPTTSTTAVSSSTKGVTMTEPLTTTDGPMTSQSEGTTTLPIDNTMTMSGIELENSGV